MTITTVDANWIFNNQTNTIPSDVINLCQPEFTHLYIPEQFIFHIEPNDAKDHPLLPWKTWELTCIGGV